MRTIFLRENAAETVDSPQRRPEIVRNRIGKSFQFLVGGLKLFAANNQMLIEAANTILSFPAGRNVIVDLKDCPGILRFIGLQHPAAGYGNRRSIAPGVDEFAFPEFFLKQLLLDALRRGGEFSVKQSVRLFSQRLLPPPSIGLFRAMVPKDNGAVHIANENSIACQLKQLGLVFQCGRLPGQFLFHLLACTHVANRAGHQHSFWRFQGAKADLDGKFPAIFSQSIQFQTCSHGPYSWVCGKYGAVGRMPLAKPPRGQDLYGMAN